MDIHTHILPAVDDGAQDVKTTIAMLKMAYEDGTRGILLTPHYRGRYRKFTPVQLKMVFEGVAKLAEKLFPDLMLYLGQEVSYDPQSITALADGRALAVHDTNYVMLEFKTDSGEDDIRKGIESCYFYGYRPVVVHPERYDHLRKDKALVEELLNHGVLLQLNADSVLGENGHAVKRFCHKLLENRSVSFIASDAHDTVHRPPQLRECYLYVCRKYGEEYARQIFYDNAKKMISNEDV